ncbi:heat shock factor protein-like protein [Euroglyphus maynei]|uniref:Heat shock factor protein-like protein n=1 Tax=Euroglyphus maynei TaxID=6958 RepID=A0A1Y3APG4_EURMA|nr:heat shock factor protein-like protein [Euroglyphus maynei]
MHTLGSNSNVPTFILKLWKLVCDESNNDLICWNRNGHSFIIKDHGRFAKEILPLYFKHSNMASFIRQLNMYGFRKVSNIEHGGLKSDGDEVEFFHRHFCLGQADQLELIKRKMSTSNNNKCLTSIVKVDEIHDILADVESIKGRQDSVDTLLNNLKQENESLWREIAILRQKHLKQQQIVEKLLQFLVSIVRNSVVGGLKRKAPLLIDSNVSNSRKIIKNKEGNTICIPSPPSNSGPIIHDITDLEESTNLRNDSLSDESPSFINGLQFDLDESNNHKLLQTSNSDQTTSLVSSTSVGKGKSLSKPQNTMIDLPQIFEIDLANQLNNPQLVNNLIDHQQQPNYNMDNADSIITEAELLNTINHVSQQQQAPQPTTSNQLQNNFSTELILPSKQKGTNSTNLSRITTDFGIPSCRNFNDHLFSFDNQFGGVDTGSTSESNTIPKAIMDCGRNSSGNTDSSNNQNKMIKIEDDNSSSSLFDNIDLSNIGNDTKGLSQPMILRSSLWGTNGQIDTDILSEFTSEIDSSHFN